MQSFGIPMAPTLVTRTTKSKWDSGDSKTVIPNVACILPPDLKSDLLHAYLLRFQFEEVQYKIKNLEDETKNVNFGENLMNNFTLDNKLQVTADVRARDSLVQERRQITESIEKVYPIFRAPLSLLVSITKSVKRVEIPSYKLLGVILGPRATMLRQIEKDFNVRISVRGPSNTTDDNAPPEERGHLLIIGNTEDEVTRCAKKINSIISSEGGIVNTNTGGFNQDVDPDQYSLSFNPNEDKPPWEETVKGTDTSGYNTFDSAYDELLNSLTRNDTVDEETESEERRKLFKKFTVDLARTDISSLMDEPLPPGFA
ncbi:splicing factor 1 [Histomonas meleagridis]|uniref:splicing factor 1 n=1 Tax=Histomonas meleagridis TaxID=135588 RepID=UPI00355A118A|nr:splicing factor 1 [Histomonas meleagridis]KAH0800065.1 splicing factor 1 [Histomonas meleagridis]